VDQQLFSHFSRAISVLVFVFGALSCGAIISGDDLGRVNLIHYLLLFSILPLITLVAMLLGLFSQSTDTRFLSNFLLSLPIWPRPWLTQLRALKQHQLLDRWIAFISQLIGLSFGLGCLSAFIVVLLFSDVSFVWRSTLLNAQDVYPFLAALAWPWQFIESAQPIKEVLIASQELRYLPSDKPSVDYGTWWQFLFVAQIFYGIIPRLIGTLWTKWVFNQAFKTHIADNTVLSPLVNQQPIDIELAPISDNRPQLDNYNVICWLSLPPTMMERAINNFSSPQMIYQAGFHGDDEQAAIDDPLPQLVLVAAWEPPLGELADFLARGQGVIMPLDFNQNSWQPLAKRDVDEWQRFAQSQPNWTLFIDKELTS